MHDNNSQKSFGKLDVEVKNNELKKFFQKGCAKSFIPKNDNSTTELVTLNTAGGLTSGDNFVTNFKLNNSKICISTQAAEKIYSGYGYPARVENKVIIDDSSTLFWMPQELILFNNSKLERNSYFDLKTTSNLLICETIIFGRRSMNENIENILISDQWEIKINDKIKHFETVDFKGVLRDYFKNKSALSNNCAFNFIFGYGESLINKAETIDKNLLNHENTDMAISIWDEKFIIRSVSEDNYDLRIALQKILPYFYNNELPKMWKF